MTDNEVSSIFNSIKLILQHNSRSLSDYEKGKAIIRELSMTPQQYQYLINKLAAWVGV